MCSGNAQLHVMRQIKAANLGCIYRVQKCFAYMPPSGQVNKGNTEEDNFSQFFQQENCQSLSALNTNMYHLFNSASTAVG